MKIKLIDRFADLRSYAAQWNDLLARTGSPSVFLTWEWIEPWWEVFGAKFDLAVLFAEKDGRLVGIAPLMTGPLLKGTGGGLMRALMFVGQRGDTLAEYLDFIVEPGREADVVEAFAEYLG
jgi:CelD/BcsL family acetyltransferase involved in cellulose biosynthesis